MRWPMPNPFPHLSAAARRVLFAAVPILLLSGALELVAPGTASAGETGKINVVRNATSEFDRYTGGASAAEQEWIRNHYSAIRGYAPYFDRALSWAPPAEFYKDLYAIYSDERTFVSQHPSWILRDSGGSPLYIPWDCNGSTCSQYAGDIGNPEFRRWWIGEAEALIAKGYSGVFIDDVNMKMQVGNARGELVHPLDPRTGTAMTEVDWQRYVAEFTEEIRAALSGVKITHNALWWMGEGSYARREVESADVVNLERGVNDSGIVGGGGRYGFETFLSYIDWVHGLGRSVMFGSYISSSREGEYEVASYLLATNGTDSLCANYRADPDEWWPGWESNLGEASGPRYRWNGLQRRDFSNGTVLVAEPGSPARTVSLGSQYRRIDGSTVEQVTLGADEGVVLSFTGGDQGVPPPAAEPPPGGSEGSSSGSPDDGNSPAGGAQGGAEEAPPAGAGESSVQVTGQITSGGSRGVVIEVQRKVGRRWKKVRNVRAKADRRGHFEKRIKRLRRGRYRVRGELAGWRSRGRAVVRRHRRFFIG